jgi:hypothetical protein
MYKRGKYKLIHIDGDGNKSGMVFDDEMTIGEMCERFARFLRVSGFVFDCQAEIEVVYPEIEE